MMPNADNHGSYSSASRSNTRKDASFGIAIIDYGMGNIHSVQKALQLSGAQTLVTNKPSDIKACEKLVLPGVGAFDDAMVELEDRKLVSAIREHVNSKKPFLGICLGMQLLFEKSQEAKEKKGLGILQGLVRRFEERKGLKVPHMGWNQLRKVTLLRGQASHSLARAGKSLPIGRGVTSNCPLLKDITEGSCVYFCHSYYPAPKDASVVAAVTDYGVEFCSVVWRDNVFGVQFHPEKSQAIGLRMLKNFVELC